MVDITAYVINNKYLFELFCTTYEKLITSECEPYSIHFSGEESVPFLRHTYMVSKEILQAINTAKDIIPLGVSVEQHALRLSLIEKNIWDGLSAEMCQRELGLEKTAFYRIKKKAYNNLYKAVDLLLKERRNISILSCNREGQIVLETDNPSEKYDLFNLTDDKFQMLKIFFSNNYYNTFLKAVIREIKRVPINGLYYYYTTKAIVERKSKNGLVEHLHRYTLKTCSYKVVKKYIEDAETIIGVILFSINYFLLIEHQFLLQL